MPIRVVEKAHTPTQAEDIARSGLTGFTEAVASVPGVLGDLREFGQTALESGAKFARDHGVKLSAPKLELGGPFGGYVPLVAGAAAKVAGADPRLARLATALTSPGSLAAAPTTREVLGAATKDKPLYQPQTRAGRYARAITQMAPAAAVPGSTAQRLANVLVPGAASEGAAELAKVTGHQELESYARVAGALLGAGGAHLMTGGHPRTRILAEHSRGATDADIAAARALMERAQGEGVQLTMPEALQQVTGGATSMTRLQRVVEGTPGGAERLTPLMSQRPTQVREAVANYADSIAPATDQPSMIGAAAQEAADQGLNGVRRFVNFGAQPHYDALPGQMIPEAQYAQLAQNQSYATALAALRNHPELGAAVANLPDNDVAVVNEVLKRLNTTAEQVRPGPMNPQGDHGLAALRDQAAGNANEIASAASPDFRAAREAVAAGRAEYLEPLQRGPLGAISGTDNVPAQTRALYPSAPLEGAADETRRAIGVLGSQNAQVPADLTRQHLVNALNEATQNLQGGENQWGGARFATAVAGNPEQERTLLAGVEASGGDPDRLRYLIEALQATGRRERPGSMTAFNTRDMERLGQAGLAGEALRTGLNPPGAFRRLGMAFQDWQTERNAGRLAEAIVADPAQAEAILLHARQVVPPGEELRAIERAALAAQLSRQPQLEAAQ